MRKLKYVKLFENFQVNEGIFDIFGSKKNKEQEEQIKQNKKKIADKEKQRIEIVFPGSTEGLKEEEHRFLHNLIFNVCFWGKNLQTRDLLGRFFTKLKYILEEKEKGVEMKNISSQEKFKFDKKELQALNMFCEIFSILKDGEGGSLHGKRLSFDSFKGKYETNFTNLHRFFKNQTEHFSKDAVSCIEKLVKLTNRDPHSLINIIQTWCK